MSEETKKPALLLLPNLLGEQKRHEMYLPAGIDKAVISLDGLIAESAQGGRRYLSRFPTTKPTQDIPIALLNEHTKMEDLDFLLEPIVKGERWGLISDSGCPCIADPGAHLVARARHLGIVVQAFVGPSSIIMSLMLSGFSGQHFTFHGYLDKDSTKRQNQIRNLENTAQLQDYTQIFIETPYRNQQTLQS